LPFHSKLYDGIDDDRAAGRILAIERALRSLEYLNHLGVRHLGIQGRDARLIYAIHVDRHVRAVPDSGCVGRNAADGRQYEGAVKRQLEAWSDLGEIEGADDARFDERIL
jgi:hypothetical protein